MDTRKTPRESLAHANPQTRRSIRSLGVFALGVVPVYTLVFACQGDLIGMSLSRLGNRPGHYGRFVLWGLVCVCFLFVLFRKTFTLARYSSRLGMCLLLAACAAFLACVVLPFVPDQYPRAAKWHNELAFLSAILTLLVSLALSLHLRKVNRTLCLYAMLQWSVNLCICFHLLRTTGVTSLLESLYIIMTCLHTYGITAKLTRAGNSTALSTEDIREDILGYSHHTSKQSKGFKGMF